VKPLVSYRCPSCHSSASTEQEARLCCAPQAVTVSTCSLCNRVASSFQHAEQCCVNTLFETPKERKLRQFYNDRGLPVPKVKKNKKNTKSREPKQSLSSMLGEL